MEFDEPVSMTSASVRETFNKLSLQARFVGITALDVRPKSKTQRLA